MESRTLSAKALFEQKKWFSARNQYLDDCHTIWMRKFYHHVDEEQDGNSEDEKLEEYSKEEE